MIKKSSFIVAILLIVCLSISSVSATAMDNNSSNEILNSTGMTTDDIDTINDCSVAHNLESEESVVSNNVDQSSIDMTRSSIDSVSNVDSEESSDISNDNSVSTNDVSDESVVATENVDNKADSVSFANAKSEDNEELSADDSKALDDVSLANNFESQDSDVESLDDVSIANKVAEASNNQDESSDISVSNVDSGAPSSNDATNDESIGSVSVPYEVNNINGGMSDNIGQADIANQNTVSDPVMITSTMADVSYSDSDVMNTEIISLLTAQSILTDQSVLTSGSTSGANVSISDIIQGAITLKQYVLDNKELPLSVSVNGETYTISEFTYLMSMAINNLKDNKTSDVTVINVTNHTTKVLPVNVTANKTAYLIFAEAVAKSGDTKGVLRDNVSVYGKKIDFNLYTFGFAKILADYNDNGVLPDSCLYDSSVFDKTEYVSVSQIIAAAKSLKSYTTSNAELPSVVSVGNYNVSIAQFSYLMSKAISNINDKNKSDIEIINVTNHTTEILSVNVTANKTAYLIFAEAVAKSGEDKGVLRDNVSVYGNKIDFNLYTFGFAKILTYYKDNGVLPNSCLYDSSVFFKPPTNGSVSISQIIKAARTVKSYTISNAKLPSVVSVGKYNVTIAQFSYLMSKAINNLKDKNRSNIEIISVANPNTKVLPVNVQANETAYLIFAKAVAKSGDTKGVLRDNVSVYGNKIDFNLYTFGFAKILVFCANERIFPNYCVFDSSVLSSNHGLSIKKGINEYNVAKNLSIYLKASGHCALNSKIKSLATSLTKNCNTTWEKATAIYNYARDSISYSFYYNSQKSASGTLSSKSANCCDKSNLIVALCRASNIPARYCHSTSCHFSSGLVCGHVWAQILVDDLWVCADATSSRNSLGHINNWNTGAVGSINQYASIPF